jgi:non-ribosomal peptide synthetase component F
VNWSYRTELFESATMTRMAGHFETILASIVEQPDAPLSKLEMLTAAEREQRERAQSERREARRDRLKRRA